MKSSEVSTLPFSNSAALPNSIIWSQGRLHLLHQQFRKLDQNLISHSPIPILSSRPLSVGNSAPKTKMIRALCKVVDLVLLLTFLTISVVAPFLDAQIFLPQWVFPDVLIRFHKWYTIEHQDYLLMEKPHFFTALMKLELVFQFPLALVNIYGLLASKPWFNTTCLIFGASLMTHMTAILGEMVGSQKASDKLIMMYSPFWGLGILALLRGLLSQCGKASSVVGNGPGLVRKKRV